MSAVPAVGGSNRTSGSDRRTIAIYEYAPWFNGAPGSYARLPLAAGPGPASGGRDGNQYDTAHYWLRGRTQAATSSTDPPLTLAQCQRPQRPCPPSRLPPS